MGKDFRGRHPKRARSYNPSDRRDELKATVLSSTMNRTSVARLSQDARSRDSVGAGDETARHAIADETRRETTTRRHRNFLRFELEPPMISAMKPRAALSIGSNNGLSGDGR